ncbi:hypothetical protein J3P86_01435 [Pseudomonas sp. D1-1]
MSKGLLLVGPGAHRVRDALALEVVHTESLILGEHTLLDCMEKRGVKKRKKGKKGDGFILNRLRPGMLGLT